MSFMPALLASAYFSPPSSARYANPNTLSRCVRPTTTTSCLRARLAPSYGIMFGDPAEYPPPCSQTITGRLSTLVAPGVQRLRLRQSSPIGSRRFSGAHSGTSTESISGDRRPVSNASRTPVHGCIFTGGRNRRAPAVDEPYGTPLNAWIFSMTRPRTLPAVVSTVAPGTPFPLCAHTSRQSSNNAPAAATVVVPMNARRFISAPPDSAD